MAETAITFTDEDLEIPLNIGLPSVLEGLGGGGGDWVQWFTVGDKKTNAINSSAQCFFSSTLFFLIYFFFVSTKKKKKGVPSPVFISIRNTLRSKRRSSEFCPKHSVEGGFLKKNKKNTRSPLTERKEAWNPSVTPPAVVLLNTKTLSARRQPAGRIVAPRDTFSTRSLGRNYGNKKGPARHAPRAPRGPLRPTGVEKEEWECGSLFCGTAGSEGHAQQV